MIARKLRRILIFTRPRPRHDSGKATHRLRSATLVVLAALALAAADMSWVTGLPASAAPAGNLVWVNAATPTCGSGGQYCAAWYNPNNDGGVFEEYGDNYTKLTAQNCSGVYCEFRLPNGNCMAYYASGTKGIDLIDEHSCNGASYEEWNLAGVGSIPGFGYTYEFISKYLNGVLCAKNFYQAMTAAGNGYQYRMACPDYNSTTLGNDQVWTWYSTFSPARKAGRSLPAGDWLPQGKRK